jgi:hypothetical protein
VVSSQSAVAPVVMGRMLRCVLDVAEYLARLPSFLMRCRFRYSRAHAFHIGITAITSPGPREEDGCVSHTAHQAGCSMAQRTTAGRTSSPICSGKERLCSNANYC